MRALDGHHALITLKDSTSGMLAHLAIDSTYDGESVGGIRILPDVTRAEISHLARTMTRKCLFGGVPEGGAKAGIALGKTSVAERNAVLTSFGRALAPHIAAGFWPGLDMGCSPEDLRTILRAAGLPAMRAGAVPTHVYTAWTVMHSIDAALESRAESWSGCRIAVEGFGKVGSQVASLAASRGATVVAVSDLHGSLHSPSGLDVGLLIALRERYGPAFVHRYPGISARPRKSIFGAGCDVLVPAARCWSLDPHAASLRAPIIACAANVPMAPATERSLWKRGTAIVPDCIANCGGVVGGRLSAVMPDKDIDAIFATRFRERVHDLLVSGMQPSEWLDTLCASRREALKQELAPRKEPRQAGLAGFFERHISEPLFGRKKLEGMLFPEGGGR